MSAAKMSKFMLAMSAITAFSAAAMPVKTEMKKPRAYFQEANNNLLEALDLKTKTLYFGKAEFDACGAALVRKAKTLAYSCTIKIPTTSKISKLQTQVTPKSKEISFGATKRTVLIQVSEDARQMTMSTAFDATGLDFDLSKFNDDIFAVNAKVAQLIIADAMKAQPVRIDVLESR